MSWSSISETLNALFSLERRGVKMGLEHTEKLLFTLGNPQEKLNLIHIAGTNGKGSTSSHMECVLRGLGKKVGLYTSPHLVKFNERIRVNGIPITDQEIKSFLKQSWANINKIKSTFFETTTVLAFYYFCYKKVDIAIIETGLGGRLDSTNVLNPNLTIITPIDIDHQKFLGNTINEIAHEKAGIIKKNTPVITTKQPKKVLDILINRAEMLNSKIDIVNDPDKIFIDDYYTKFAVDKKEFSIPLLGEHQAYNASLAIRASSIFIEKLNYQTINDGLLTTIWPGRFQRLNKKLPIFYDVAHNSAGINTIRLTLESINASKKIGLIVLKEDKEVDYIAKSLKGLFDELIISTLPNSQLMDQNQLFDSLKKHNITCKIIYPIEKAFNYISVQSEKGAISVIFGSHYAAKSIYNFFEINFDNVSI